MEEEKAAFENLKGLSEELAKAGFEFDDILAAAPGLISFQINEVELLKAVAEGYLRGISIRKSIPERLRLSSDKLAATLELAGIVASKIFSGQEEGREDQILRQTAISNLLYQKKKSQLVRLGIITGISEIALTTFHLISQQEIKFSMLIGALVLLPLTITWLRNALIRHRILRGYYGNNGNEAKELLAFINSIVDDIPPSGGGRKEIKAFPDDCIENEEPIIDSGLLGEGA